MLIAVLLRAYLVAKDDVQVAKTESNWRELKQLFSWHYENFLFHIILTDELLQLFVVLG